MKGKRKKGTIPRRLLCKTVRLVLLASVSTYSLIYPRLQNPYIQRLESTAVKGAAAAPQEKLLDHPQIPTS